MSNSGDSISPKYSAWLRGDDRYAALNYWIMWENSEVANGKPLNLLERLNHVYTDVSIDETRGPSMFEKVLDLVRTAFALFSCPTDLSSSMMLKGRTLT
jgi:hypothetical protein